MDCELYESKGGWMEAYQDGHPGSAPTHVLFQCPGPAILWQGAAWGPGGVLVNTVQGEILCNVKVTGETSGASVFAKLPIIEMQVLFQNVGSDSIYVLSAVSVDAST